VLQSTRGDPARAAQGELEQGRRLMRRVASENRHLHAIVRRGRAAVGELEAALPGGAPPSAAVAAAAGALSSLARPRARASRLPALAWPARILRQQPGGHLPAWHAPRDSLPGCKRSC